MIFNDQKLRQTLWGQYFGLQKQVDTQVAALLDLDHSPWEINPLEEQTVAELETAIHNITFVLFRESHGLTRILWRFLKHPVDPEEFDGQGLA